MWCVLKIRTATETRVAFASVRRIGKESCAEALSPTRPRMSFKNPRRTAVSSGPGLKENPDLSQFVRKFERLLDKYIDNGRYVPPITTNPMDTE